MSHLIGIGEIFIIPQREITEEMHDLRASRGIEPKHDLENGAKAKILRVYTRQRGQEVLTAAKDDNGTEVTVTALAKGQATVDIIDEISEPWGYDTEFVVVRKPQLTSVEVAAKSSGATEVKADLG